MNKEKIKNLLRKAYQRGVWNALHQTHNRYDLYYKGIKVDFDVPDTVIQDLIDEVDNEK